MLCIAILFTPFLAAEALNRSKACFTDSGLSRYQGLTNVFFTPVLVLYLYISAGALVMLLLTSKNL
ncbi:hypothetical protein D3C71_2126850 [compost metagenome]